jgi:trimeric autotransporter adhesin
VELEQSGDNNTSLITQGAGSLNVATVSQGSDFNTSTVTQNGSGSTATVTQGGGI